MMHGKIHRATVTDANPDYQGSLTLDPLLMEAAGMLAFEQVHVLDVDNGARVITYVIEGEPGSGEVVVNGAAALRISRGDRVIIVAYAEMDEAEARVTRPRVVIVNERNRPLSPVAYD